MKKWTQKESRKQKDCNEKKKIIAFLTLELIKKWKFEMKRERKNI